MEDQAGPGAGPVQGQPVQQPVANVNPAQLRVLVVDSKPSRNSVANLLRECGYQVTVCRTSREALQQLLPNSGAEGTAGDETIAPQITGIDLLLKEHEPPQSDARRLLKRMARSELLRRTPVVVMSSQDDREVVMNCLSLGAIDFLVKPLRHNELRHIWTRVWWWRRSGLSPPTLPGADAALVPPPANHLLEPPLDLFGDPYQSSDDSKETKCDEEEEPTSKEGSAPDGNNGSNGNGHNSNGSKDAGNGTSRAAQPQGTNGNNGNGSSDNKNGHHGSNGNGASTTLVERNGAHPLANTAEGRAPLGLVVTEGGRPGKSGWGGHSEMLHMQASGAAAPGPGGASRKRQLHAQHHADHADGDGRHGSAGGMAGLHDLQESSPGHEEGPPHQRLKTHRDHAYGSGAAADGEAAGAGRHHHHHHHHHAHHHVQHHGARVSAFASAKAPHQAAGSEDTNHLSQRAQLLSSSSLAHPGSDAGGAAGMQVDGAVTQHTMLASSAPSHYLPKDRASGGGEGVAPAVKAGAGGGSADGVGTGNSNQDLLMAGPPADAKNAGGASLVPGAPSLNGTSTNSKVQLGSGQRPDSRGVATGLGSSGGAAGASAAGGPSADRAPVGALQLQGAHAQMAAAVAAMAAAAAAAAAAQKQQHQHSQGGTAAGAGGLSSAGGQLSSGGAVGSTPGQAPTGASLHAAQQQAAAQSGLAGLTPEPINPLMMAEWLQQQQSSFAAQGSNNPSGQPPPSFAAAAAAAAAAVAAGGGAPSAFNVLSSAFNGGPGGFGLPGQPLLGLPHNRAGTYGAASRNLSMGNAPSLNTADGSASVAGAAPAQVPPGPFNHPLYGGPPLLQHQAAALSAAASLQANNNNNNLGIASGSQTHKQSGGSQATNGNTATGGVGPSGAPAGAAQGAAGAGGGLQNYHSNSNNNAMHNAPSGRLTPSVGGAPAGDMSTGAGAAAASRTTSAPGAVVPGVGAPATTTHIPGSSQPSPRSLLPGLPALTEGPSATGFAVGSGSGGAAQLPPSLLGITSAAGTPPTTSAGSGLPLGLSSGPQVNQGHAFLSQLLAAYQSMHQAAGDTSGTSRMTSTQAADAMAQLAAAAAASLPPGSAPASSSGGLAPPAPSPSGGAFPAGSAAVAAQLLPGQQHHPGPSPLPAVPPHPQTAAAAMAAAAAAMVGAGRPSGHQPPSAVPNPHAMAAAYLAAAAQMPGATPLALQQAALASVVPTAAVPSLPHQPQVTGRAPTPPLAGLHPLISSQGLQPPGASIPHPQQQHMAMLMAMSAAAQAPGLDPAMAAAAAAAAGAPFRAGVPPVPFVPPGHVLPGQVLPPGLPPGVLPGVPPALLPLLPPQPGLPGTALPLPPAALFGRPPTPGASALHHLHSAASITAAGLGIPPGSTPAISPHALSGSGLPGMGSGFLSSGIGSGGSIGAGCMGPGSGSGSGAKHSGGSGLNVSGPHAHLDNEPKRRRAAALDKYRAKRKNLKFSTSIRYENRKVMAEGRVRYKGQFAKAPPAGDPSAADGKAAAGKGSKGAVAPAATEGHAAEDLEVDDQEEGGYDRDDEAVAVAEEGQEEQAGVAGSGGGRKRSKGGVGGASGTGSTGRNLRASPPALGRPLSNKPGAGSPRVVGTDQPQGVVTGGAPVSQQQHQQHAHHHHHLQHQLQCGVSAGGSGHGSGSLGQGPTAAAAAELIHLQQQGYGKRAHKAGEEEEDEYDMDAVKRKVVTHSNPPPQQQQLPVNRQPSTLAAADVQAGVEAAAHDQQKQHQQQQQQQPVPGGTTHNQLTQAHPLDCHHQPGPSEGGEGAGQAAVRPSASSERQSGGAQGAAEKSKTQAGSSLGTKAVHQPHQHQHAPHAAPGNAVHAAALAPPASVAVSSEGLLRPGGAAGQLLQGGNGDGVSGTFDQGRTTTGNHHHHSAAGSARMEGNGASGSGSAGVQGSTGLASPAAVHGKAGGAVSGLALAAEGSQSGQSKGSHGRQHGRTAHGKQRALSPASSGGGKGTGIVASNAGALAAGSQEQGVPPATRAVSGHAKELARLPGASERASNAAAAHAQQQPPAAGGTAEAGVNGNSNGKNGSDSGSNSPDEGNGGNGNSNGTGNNGSGGSGTNARTHVGHGGSSHAAQAHRAGAGHT